MWPVLSEGESGQAKRSDTMGTAPIPTLLRQQAIPAALGILVLSLNGIIDTIFVGHWIDSLAIGAITVVLPISFLIAAIGMSIGVGGASIISRALGAGEREKANRVFGNQLSLTIFLALLFVFIGSFLQDEVLGLFGGKGDILPYAQIYFKIILVGIPFLAFAMMSNNVFRAEGRPKMAMMTMLIPAVVNLVLDPILIVGLDMSMHGAGWATTISYIASAAFGMWFLVFGGSEMKFEPANLWLKAAIVYEIFAIGGVTLARQGVISVLAIILNNAFFTYGGEISLSAYGIINRMMMFVNFPVFGINQGFVPIAGFNYGAEKWSRVREVIRVAITVGTGLACLIFLGIFLFNDQLAATFTKDAQLIEIAAPAMVIVFFATPLIGIQLIGASYFQAIGKAFPALMLSLSKQGFFLIPLILILPRFFGIDGIWYSFPIADIAAAVLSFVMLRIATAKLPRESV